ncbi:glycosyltransferase family 4 protein [bacterium]|nr:glycosyltransferase family 4 protein [bacterium]
MEEKISLLLVTFGMHEPWVDARITSFKALATILSSKYDVTILTTGPTEKSGYVNCIKYSMVKTGDSLGWIRLLRRLVRQLRQKEYDFLIYRPYGGFNIKNFGFILLIRLIALFKKVKIILCLWGGPKGIDWFSRLFTYVVIPIGKKEKGNLRIIAPVSFLSRINGQKEFKEIGDESSLKEHIGLFMYCTKDFDQASFNHVLYNRGLGDIIKAAALLKDLNVKFMVSIPLFENGIARDTLNEMLEKHDVRHKFILTRHIANLESVFSEFDFYIFPLKTKTIFWLPLSVIEAFWSGVPVICTNIEPVNLLIRNKKICLLYEPGNYVELAENIRTLIEDVFLRESLRNAAREFIRKYYVPEDALAKWELLLKLEK